MSVTLPRTKAPSTAKPGLGRSSIALIDAQSEFRRRAGEVLSVLYDVVEFDDIQSALAFHHSARPSVIILDESGFPEGGVAGLKRIRSEPAFQSARIIATSSQRDGRFLGTARNNGCDAVLGKPFRALELLSTITGLVNQAAEQAWDQMEPRHRDTLRTTLGVFNEITDTIKRGEPVKFASVQKACRPLVDAVQSNDFRPVLDGLRYHDDYTYVHSLRVATFLSLLGGAMGLKGDDLLTLSCGGLLHDIGKQTIPTVLLNKPGRLTDAEMEVMRGHVASSAAYVNTCSSIPRGVRIIVEQHHEKLDGSGYPRGLAGKELDELARMAAIVDIFTALTDRRSYKPPIPADDALEMMRTQMAGQLDQGMLRLFVDLLVSYTGAVGTA